MSLLHKLIPPSPNGATRFGSHFRGTWVRCPTEWAYQYLVAHPDGTGTGLQPNRPSSPLSVGGLVHLGLAAWYISRCVDGRDTGTANLDLALAAIEDGAAKDRPRYIDDPAQWEADRSLSRRIMERYHKTFNSDGLDPEYPELRVAIDADGQPIVEREFEFELGWPTDGPSLVYTVRLDLLAFYKSWLCVVEHKTSAPSRVWQVAADAEMGAQFTGEIWTLDALAKSERLAALLGGDVQPQLAARNVLVNILNKQPAQRPSAKSPPEHMRHLVSRDPAQLRKFHLDFVTDLADIETHLERYQGLRDQGVGQWEAIRRVFPMRGTATGLCPRCDYRNLCQSLGREDGALAGYRPRVWTGDEPKPKDEDAS